MSAKATLVEAHGAPAAPLDEASAVATKAIEAAIEVLRKEEETTAVARGDASAGGWRGRGTMRT